MLLSRSNGLSILIRDVTEEIKVIQVAITSRIPYLADQNNVSQIRFLVYSLN
jgi:hypothetical protein